MTSTPDEGTQEIYATIYVCPPWTKNSFAQDILVGKQRERCEEKAEEMGIEVEGIYMDNLESEYYTRPQLKALLNDLVDYPIAYVIIAYPKVLASSSEERLQLERQIADSGAQLVICNEDLLSSLEAVKKIN